MVREQLVARGVRTRCSSAAMGEVPRERFVPPGLIERAYSDGALAIGGGQTISQPYIVARMSEALELPPVDPTGWPRRHEPSRSAPALAIRRRSLPGWARPS